MRIGVACIVAMVAACSNRYGLYVTVTTSDKTIDTEELFLGEGSCVDPDSTSPCAIRPPDQTAPLTIGTGGGAWTRDADQVFKQSPVTDRETFYIEASGSDQTLQVIAVGEANGAADSVGEADDQVLPQHDVHEITIALVASPLPPAAQAGGPAPPDGDYVDVWNQSPQLSDCVVHEHVQDGVIARTFIVPSEDPDCDTYPTYIDGVRNSKECRPLWYQATITTPMIQDGSCPAQTTMIVPAVVTCVLGGTPCTDGVGPDPTGCIPVMGPTTYCLPSQLCNCHDTSISACVAAEPTAVTHLACTFYADPTTGFPCTLTAPSSTPSDLSALGTTCAAIEFAKVDALAGATTESSMFYLAPPATAMFTMPVMPGCKFLPTWEGMYSPASTWTGGSVIPPIDQHEIADVSFDNGSHALLPLELAVKACPLDGIAAPAPSCTLTFSANDTVAECANDTVNVPQD